MADSERDPISTTPPPGLRSVQFQGPVSGLRDERAEHAALAETEPEPRVNDTELSLTEPGGPNPDTLMSLPKPLPHD